MTPRSTPRSALAVCWLFVTAVAAIGFAWIANAFNEWMTDGDGDTLPR